MYALIQTTLVALVCWLLIVFLKNTRPHIIQRIITTTLLLCLVIPVLNVFDVPYQLQTTFDPQPVITEVELAAGTEPTTIQQSVKQNENMLPPVAHIQDSTTHISWTLWLLGLWLFGVVLCLFKHIKSFFHIHRLIHTGQTINFELKTDVEIQKKINLLMHQEAKIPFLYVFSEVYVVLPTQAKHWNSRNLHDVILHELCHYRRKDHWLVWLSLLISTIYWFHPIIRLLIKKQRQYIELACDQQLLAEGLDKHNYAESLMLVTSDFKQAQTVIGMATEPHLLSSRIHSIISDKPTLSGRHKCIISLGVALLITTGCIQVDQADHLEAEDMLELISYDLPLIRNEKMPKGELHLSAFYDGVDVQNAYFHLQLENQNKQKKWIRLGPLKKFTEHVHTWHFKLSEGVEMTGKYKVTGVEPDGVVDGIAVGLASLSHSGEFVMLKTHGPITGEVPNVICSWPLWIGERRFNTVLPQMTHSNPESVQRLLCGSQLMTDGEYSF